MLFQYKSTEEVLIKMIKDIRNFSVGKKIMFILCALATFIFDFFYINWISYRMALSNMESERFIPLEISILSAIAFVFCGYCPACNEVHNPIYKFLYKIFTGSEYTYL